MGLQRWIAGALVVSWAALAGAAGAKAPAAEVRVTEHPSGAMASECLYVGEQRHGRCTTWFEDGTKESEGDYRDGLRHGPWVIWVRRPAPEPSAAALKIIGTHGGTADGVTVADIFGEGELGDLDALLADVDGVAVAEPPVLEPPPVPVTGGPALPNRYREEGSYDANHRVGTWRGFHESGTKLYEGQYDLMMMASEDGTWSVVGPPPPEGDPPSRQGPWTYWYESGVTMRTEVHRNGGPHGPAEGFYPSGQKEFSGTLWMASEHGDWTYWHEDGSLRAAGTWEHSEPMGRWTFHHPGGAKRAEGWIEAGMPSGEWTFWTSDGEAMTRTLADEGF